MKVRILFSDKLHFHERNFASLVKLVNEEKYEVEYNTENQDWMSLYGDYASKDNVLQGYTSLLSKLSANELYNFSVRNVDVFSVAKAEMLAYLIPKHELYKTELTSENREIFDFVFNNHKHELLLNMAAAMFWLDFWYNKVITNKQKYSHVFTFSGSNIYAKALVKTCQSTISRCFVMETSLTGNDYYVEEKLSHIANNSDIKLLAVRKKHLMALDSDLEKQNTIVKAINKLTLSNNKNVTQPLSELQDIAFDNSKPCISIFGQVVNDYSIIETNLPYLSSVTIYIKLIDKILKDTDLNIVFKSHPWEENKTHCDTDITYSAISEFIDSLPSEYRNRVKITKDFNIDVLLDYTQHALVINSQSGLEAAAKGIKPIIYGDAFYGKYGFTFDSNDLCEIVKHLRNHDSSLTLSEFDKYQEFLAIYLEKHLFSVNPSGQKKLKKEVFTPTPKIRLVDKKMPEKKPEVSANSEDEQTIDSIIEHEIKELSASTKIKNGIVYLFTDFEKFKKKVKSRI